MKPSTSIIRIVTFLGGSIILALLAACELALSYPVAWWLYLVTGILGAVALVRRVPLRKQFLGLTVCAAWLGVIAVLYFVPWTSRKPFLRDLARVRVGMSEAEVRRIMGGHLEGTGWPTVPSATATNASATLTDVGSGAQHVTATSPSGELALRDALVFRHSNDGRFNSDWGIVSLSSGRVVRVEFSAD